MSDSLSTSGQQEAKEQRFAELVEEIARKVQAGQSVDLEDCARTHPEHAAEMREFFPAIQAMADLGLSLSAGASGAPAAAGAEPVSGTLGDYRIVREIGRGGMGVVYEAEQVSLRRRVALKVLPFAAVLDPKQLQRFKNEAQAAASLRHPSIVQVFAVGCERGVHYYAMDYIEGRTLAEVIHELTHAPEPQGEREASPADAEDHPPTRRAEGDTEKGPQAAVSTEASAGTRECFRSAAQLGVQAAEALEHAHQMGVVHRDIKPSNLLTDAAQHLWITDFGLAMTRTAANLTMTGDVLGTLRYMSPEQAAGKSRVLDHRTDIYSLGATLYELLTLQPAFDGADRQRLMRQVTDEDPRAPRQWNRSIPGDLETIVLKAMAKEPQDRYATAQELADDLRRFLQDEPIRARRPSLANRARRWSRRHRPVVWSAAATVVLAIALLSASTVTIAGAYGREKTQRQLAVRQQQLAEKQRRLAIEQQRRAEAAAKREREARVEAERQRKRAEANLRLAMEALDEIFLRVTETNVSGAKQTKEEREAALLQGALDFYNRFAAANKTAPELRPNVEQAYRKIIALYSKLASVFPRVLGYRRDLALASISFAGLLQAGRRPEEAEKSYQKGLAIEQELAESFPTVPEFRKELAEGHREIASLFDVVGREEKAREHRERAEALERELNAIVEAASSEGVSFTDFGGSDRLALVRDAVVADGSLQPSPGKPRTFGAAWLREKQLVAFGFETSFTFQAKWDDGGGLAFVIQNHSATAIGGGGSGLGYGSGEGRQAIDAIDRVGIPNSLAVEFDPTLHADNLTAQHGRHISVQTRGRARNSARPDASLGLVFPSVKFNDGRSHVAKIRYIPGVLSVYLDGLAQPILTVRVELEQTLDLDQGSAWVGFTAATYTAHAPSAKEIFNWQFKPLVEGAGPAGSVERGPLATAQAARDLWIESPTASGHAAEDEEVEGEQDEKAVDSISEEDTSFLNKAIAFYEELANLNSDDPDIRQDVGRAYWRTAAIHRRLGRPVEAFGARLSALDTWRKLVDDFPKIASYDSLWQRASLAATTPILPTAQCDQAIAHLSERIQSASDSAESYLLYLWRARLYWKKGNADSASADYSQAIDRLAKLTEQHPQTDVYRKQLAYAYFERADMPFHRKEYAKAFPDLDQAIYFRPDYPQALDHRGAIHYEEGRLDLALADFSESIRLGAPYIGSFSWRARIYSDKGEYDRAIADCSDLIRRGPNSAAAYTLRAKCYELGGKYDLAVKDCNRAMRLDPKYAIAYNNRGLAYFFKRDYQPALNNYSRAIRMASEGDPVPYGNRGQTYATIGDYKRATADFSEAVRCGTDTAAMHYRLAVARLAASDLDGYRAACEDMLDRFRQSEVQQDAHWTAWSCLLTPDSLADWSPAIALAQKAVESAPDSVRNRITQGAVLYRAGRYEDAAVVLKIAEELLRTVGPPEGSSPAYLWFFLAMCHDRLGKKEEAGRYLASAVDSMQAELQADLDNPAAALSWNRRVTLRLFYEESRQTAAFSGVDEEKRERIARQLESHAVKIAPDYYEKAEAYAETGWLDERIADYTEAVQLDPQDDWNYRMRGFAYAWKGEYEAALSDFTKLCELKFYEGAGYRRAGRLLMIAGREQYREACGDLVRVCRDSEDASELCFAARACALGPDAVDDPLAPVKLAQRAVKAKPGLQWMIHTLGMVHYRAGQLEKAEQYLRQSLEIDANWKSKWLNLLGLAMVRLQRGDLQGAQEWFTKAVNWMDLHREDNLNISDWIEGELLRREAEELLHAREKNPDSTAREEQSFDQG